MHANNVPKIPLARSRGHIERERERKKLDERSGVVPDDEDEGNPTVVDYGLFYQAKKVGWNQFLSSA